VRGGPPRTFDFANDEDKEKAKANIIFFFSLKNTRSVFYESTKKGNIISSLSRYKEAKTSDYRIC
jgi:hypothetical protein